MFDGNFPALDIRSFMLVLVALLAIVALITFFTGVRSIRDSRRLRYYRLRRSRLVAGWRTILISLILAGVTFVVSRFGEPVVYSVYRVSPTPTRPPTETVAPTITETPTPSLSPTLTPTLSESLTPTLTPTPHVPIAVEVQFSASITPPADAVFSPLRFAQGIDLAYNPIDPSQSFNNPITKMYAIFSYDKMADGVQWTALWYRDGELVYFETKPWEGGTGGFGFSDWQPMPEAWQPGNYQVHIFIGLELKVSGEFSVSGFPPTITPTYSNSDHYALAEPDSNRQQYAAPTNAHPDPDQYTATNQYTYPNQDLPAHHHLYPHAHISQLMRWTRKSAFWCSKSLRPLGH